ncbi:MAG: ATP-binding protein [Candidatus Micrarchaeota archaeon]
MMLPDLLEEYSSFCRLRREAKKSGTLGLAGMKRLHPATTLLLGEFIRSNRDSLKYAPSKDAEVAKCLSAMAGKAMDGCRLVKLPEKQEEANKLAEKLPDLAGIEKACGGRAAFRYLVYELVDNAYQHSGFSNAAFMVESRPEEKATELSVFDNGVSIPGSLKQSGFKFEDDEAVFKAVNGVSTKKERERGFGLGSCLKIASKALKGKALVVSGCGAFYVDEAVQQGYRLAGEDALHGTLVSLSLPFTSKEIDIYAYLE